MHCLACHDMKLITSTCWETGEIKVNRSTLILPMVTAFILAGCGSGNDTAAISNDASDVLTANDANESDAIIDSTDELISTVGDNSAENVLTDEMNVDSSGQTLEEITVETDTPDQTPVETPNASDAEPVSVVPDPLIQNTTRIDFGITVPTYASTTLQVRLLWGDKNIAVDWIGDGFWSVAEDFPTDTENLLSISFTEGNGNITLGRFETNFRTGTNAAQSVQITADQFDTCLLYTSPSPRD